MTSFFKKEQTAMRKSYLQFELEKLEDVKAEIN
jgi:hypothetical protein